MGNHVNVGISKLDYWESQFDKVTSFYTLSVLLFVGEGCELCNDTQRNALLSLDTIIQELSHSIETWKEGNVEILERTAWILHCFSFKATAGM